MYIGRIKGQEFRIQTGTYRGLKYISDALETIEVGGVLRCQSIFRFKKKGSLKLSTCRMMSSKWPDKDYWVSYPAPFTKGAGYKDTHFHTDREVDQVVITEVEIQLNK